MSVFAVGVFSAIDASPAVAGEAITRELADGVWISAQVMPPQVAALKAQGFRTLIDLRPDGEGADQPSAGTMRAAAQANELGFRYLPIPNGEIAASAVDTLQQDLASAERPLVIYCRSGRRAARSWALAEASRAGGLDAAAITSAVQAAGQDAGDLRDQIEARIDRRPSSP